MTCHHRMRRSQTPLPPNVPNTKRSVPTTLLAALKSPPSFLQEALWKNGSTIPPCKSVLKGAIAEPSGSKDLPYFGCITPFFSLPQSIIQRGQGDTGDCMQTFDQACVNAITGSAKSTVRNANGQSSNICSDLILPSRSRTRVRKT